MATLSIYCRPTIPRTTPYLSRSTSNPNSTLIHQKIRINPSLALCNRTKKRGGLCCKSMFGLGVPELVVIAGVAALVFGPKKLPEIGRGIGKTVKSFQQAAKEFESELKKEPDPAIDSPVEKTTTAAEEEKEIKVSATKESL